jgi:hypothetical protein
MQPEEPVISIQQHEEPPKPDIKKRLLKHIAAISIGIIAGIPLVLYMFFQLQGVFTRANDAAPRDVVIAGTTEYSAIVHWYTDQQTQAVILYGLSPTELTLVAPETTIENDHTVVIESLQPGTTYYFTIQIGGEVFTNGGTPWQFTTKGGAGDSGLTGTPSGTGPAGTGTGTDGSTGTAIDPATGRPVCPMTSDCTVVQELLGKGCTSSDYIKCLQRKKLTE